MRRKDGFHGTPWAANSSNSLSSIVLALASSSYSSLAYSSELFSVSAQRPFQLAGGVAGLGGMGLVPVTANRLLPGALLCR